MPGATRTLEGHPSGSTAIVTFEKAASKESALPVLLDALKKLQEVGQCLGRCVEQYPDTSTLDEELRTLRAEKARLQAENNQLTHNQIDLDTKLRSLKKTHKEEKKKLKARYQILEKAKKDSETSERVKSVELAKLEMEHRKLLKERDGEPERLGEALAENKTIVEESKGLLNLVAAEVQPRPIRDRLRDAKNVAVQFMRIALKKSIADLLAVVKSHYPSVDHGVIRAGPPPDFEEERFDELMAEAGPVAEALANEFEF